MQTFDKMRKLMENSLEMNYRIIEDNFMTEKKNYGIELSPQFVNKSKTVSIVNNVD